VAAEARFINISEWQACAAKPVIPNGAQVYAALDLGATRDLSALVLIHQDADGIFQVEPHFWLPGNVKERTEVDRVPYDSWVRAGQLTAIGDTTDPRVIAEKIAMLNGKYRIVTLAFDRWSLVGCRLLVLGLAALRSASLR
jgi:phage terminase large subunit-like protein